MDHRENAQTRCEAVEKSDVNPVPDLEDILILSLLCLDASWGAMLGVVSTHTMQQIPCRPICAHRCLSAATNASPYTIRRRWGKRPVATMKAIVLGAWPYMPRRGPDSVLSNDIDSDATSS
jgi:hypothetical protein